MAAEVGAGAVAGAVGCLLVACVVFGACTVSVGDVGSAETSIGGIACGGGGKSFTVAAVADSVAGDDGADATTCEVVRDRVAAQPITTSSARTPPKMAIDAGEDRFGNAA